MKKQTKRENKGNDMRAYYQQNNEAAFAKMYDQTALRLDAAERKRMLIGIFNLAIEDSKKQERIVWKRKYFDGWGLMRLVFGQNKGLSLENSKEIVNYMGMCLEKYDQEDDICTIIEIFVDILDAGAYEDELNFPAILSDMLNDMFEENSVYQRCLLERVRYYQLKKGITIESLDQQIHSQNQPMYKQHFIKILQNSMRKKEQKSPEKKQGRVHPVLALVGVLGSVLIIGLGGFSVYINGQYKNAVMQVETLQQNANEQEAEINRLNKELESYQNTTGKTK